MSLTSVFKKEGFLVFKILSAEKISVLQGRMVSYLPTDADLHRVNVFDVHALWSNVLPLCLDPKIILIVEKLLGPEIILENALLLLAKQGNHYKQGWHRDIWQIPQEQIHEHHLINKVHNCLQMNLAIFEDVSFWVVPGSHQRLLTEEEQNLFKTSKHLTSEDAVMPKGVCISLKPGEAIFYNNNVLHRGYNQEKLKRATLHVSYHSAKMPPTWHFYNPGFSTLSYEKALELPPEFFTLWQKNQEILKRYPNIEDSWTSV